MEFLTFIPQQTSITRGRRAIWLASRSLPGADGLTGNGLPFRRPCQRKEVSPLGTPRSVSPRPAPPFEGSGIAPHEGPQNTRLSRRSHACRFTGWHGRAGLILLMLLLQAELFAPRVLAQAFKEYDLKATFLYHLAQFVEWPTEAFPTEETPLVIGILGIDPFGKVLNEIVDGEVVKNRKLKVQRYRNVEEIKDCHILFISQSESGRLDQIFSNLKERNILTVGDTEGFAQQGGVVRFLTEKNKIRLRINIDAAKAAGLTISSKLLRAAELVGTKAGKP